MNKRNVSVYTLLTISSFLLITACNTKKSNDESGIITVDVTKQYPVKEMHLQDIADVEYIPLGSNDEFLFGDDIKVASLDNNRMVLYTFKGKIMIYDSKGNPLTYINRKGQNTKEEYSYIDKLIVDNDKEELFVYVMERFLVYDLNGNFKRNFQLPEHVKNSGIEHISNYDKDNLIIHMRFDKPPVWILSKQNGEIRQKIEIPFEKRIDQTIVTDYDGGMIGVSLKFFYIKQFESEFYITEASSDTIYRLSSDTHLSPYITRTPAIQSMNTPIFLLFGADVHRYLFMSKVVFEFDFNSFKGFPETALVYDKEDKQIYQSILYNDDYPSKKQAGIDRSVNFINRAKATAVVVFQAPDLLEANEKNELKGELKEVASKLTEDDNPVLMVVRFK
jgi:hypothetical protein